MNTPRIITKEQADKIIANMETRESIICQIMAETGLRVSDVLQLRAENITEAEPIIEKKTGKVKKLTELSMHTISRIYDYTKGQKKGLIFTGDKNPTRQMNRSVFFRRLKRVSMGLGLCYVSPHSFRKLYAKNKWLQTKDIYQVQKALNHKYVETTARYLDIDITQLIISNLK